MSRETGHRDHPKLYERILKLLKKNPKGMNAYAISQELKVNDATCRQYLADLIAEGKVTGAAVTKSIVLYSAAV